MTVKARGLFEPWLFEPWLGVDEVEAPLGSEDRGHLYSSLSGPLNSFEVSRGNPDWTTTARSGSQRRGQRDAL